MASFPIPPQTFPTGVTVTPTVNVPIGTTKAIFELDCSNWILGQRTWYDIQRSTDNGVSWSSLAKADFEGPWRNKYAGNILVTTNTLTCDWSVAFGPAPAGWLARAIITQENGPFIMLGGSLVLS